MLHPTMRWRMPPPPAPSLSSFFQRLLTWFRSPEIAAPQGLVSPAVGLLLKNAAVPGTEDEINFTRGQQQQLGTTPEGLATLAAPRTTAANTNANEKPSGRVVPMKVRRLALLRTIKLLEIATIAAIGAVKELSKEKTTPLSPEKLSQFRSALAQKYKWIESELQERRGEVHSLEEQLKKVMMTTQEKTRLTELQIAVAETKGNRMEAECVKLLAEEKRLEKVNHENEAILTKWRMSEGRTLYFADLYQGD